MVRRRVSPPIAANTANESNGIDRMRWFLPTHLPIVSALLAVAPAASAQEIASHDLAAICASDGRGGSAYSRAHRVVWRHGVAGYENDHIVPLCLGGADTDANVRLQPLDEARLKDRLEAQACREVCDGRVLLAVAQAWFMGDWRVAYQAQFGRAP
jgi:hypothetical protein